MTPQSAEATKTIKPTAKQTVLNMEHVTKRFGGLVAVSDFNLDLKKENSSVSSDLMAQERRLFST